MSNFTQGKWHVVDENGYLYVAAAHKDVCSVWGENDYDARLIAAAPEMYELLHDTLERDWPSFFHNLNHERRERFLRIKALLKRIDTDEKQS